MIRIEGALLASASQEAELARPSDRSGTTAHTEPLEDRMQMPFGGSNSDRHLPRNLGVGKTTRDVSEDSCLRRSEHGRRAAIGLSSCHRSRKRPRPIRIPMPAFARFFAQVLITGRRKLEHEGK